MRERTLKSLFDKIMWYGIYLFPLLAYLCICFSIQGSEIIDGTLPYDFTAFMYDLGFSFGPIDLLFGEIFGDGGLLHMVEYGGMLSYANYLVFVTILHVIFDIIVFIPRLFHNFLESLEKGDIIK